MLRITISGDTGNITVMCFEDIENDDANTQANVQLQFFGRVGASVDHAAKHLTKSDQKLLAFLVLGRFNLHRALENPLTTPVRNDRVHTRKEASSVLFADDSDIEGRQQLPEEKLQTWLSRLRKRIPNRLSEGSGPISIKLDIDGADSVDVFDFVDAYRKGDFETAVDMYKGRFLDDIAFRALQDTCGTPDEYESLFLIAVEKYANLVIQTNDEVKLRNAKRVLSDARSAKPGDATVREALKKVDDMLALIQSGLTHFPATGLLSAH